MGKRNTELDVLVTVRDYGELGYFDGSHTKASVRLFNLYPEFSIAYGGKVGVFVDALVGSGHLLPVNDMKGNRQQAHARGLTPKPESTEGRPWGQPMKKLEGAPLNLG